jgi:hypothetical protein
VLTTERPSDLSRFPSGPSVALGNPTSHKRGYGAPLPPPSTRSDAALPAPPNAPAHIERRLVKGGHAPAFVQAALTKLAAAPEGQSVELSPDVSIINWPTDEAKPAL